MEDFLPYLVVVMFVAAGCATTYVLDVQRKKLDLSKPAEALKNQQMKLVIKLVLLSDLIIAPVLLFVLKNTLGTP